MFTNKFLLGDVRKILPTLPTKTFHTCITSPPYWGLRDYGVAGQLGLEDSPEEYVQNLVEVFREVKRVLRDDGTLWLNLGDAYAGSGRGRYGDGTAVYGRSKQSIGQTAGVVRLPNKTDKLKPKDLIGLPWMVAFALREDGWYLRQDIIWNKPNAMPESVRDRPTKAHEYIFLFSKSPKYYYNHEAIMEDAVNGDPNPPRGSKGVIGSKNKGLREQFSLVTKLVKRNKRSVWTVSTQPFREAHYATFPPRLIEPCIIAGCPKDGVVLDPFMGSGTTAFVAAKHMRNFVGIELNQDYIKLAEERLSEVQLELINTM